MISLQRGCIGVCISVACTLSGLLGCARTSKTSYEPSPSLRVDPPPVRVALAQYGLPNDFFVLGADTKCAGDIIGYRFVAWLGDERIAVGYNMSPNCRVSHNVKVAGLARLLVFDGQGRLEAKRDLPYEADGEGVIVADGEASAGPGETLLFRIEEAGSAKSGILLLDTELQDVVRIDRFLEQTTFAEHALVFQEGFTFGDTRTYDVLNGHPPKQVEKWEENWPVGTFSRNFGQRGLAYMLCSQEVRPGKYTRSAMIYAGARERCTLHKQNFDRTEWSAQLNDGETVALTGVLADGGVVGQINERKGVPGKLMRWEKDGKAESLPWLPARLHGDVNDGTADMSVYSAFAVEESRNCADLDPDCSPVGRLLVFSKDRSTPLVDRAFARNARAAVSPDGTRYASFESGEFRIYKLPK